MEGFQVFPHRWVEERAFASLSRSRRPARDYERLPETGETMIYAAILRIMLRRVVPGLLFQAISYLRNAPAPGGSCQFNPGRQVRMAFFNMSDFAVSFL
ncbi:transposase [Belnapia rosea]|uniref:transposase n=1 Tax=Belnapia rosea TaxID=938405 RepID=UPI0034E8C08F